MSAHPPPDARVPALPPGAALIRLCASLVPTERRDEWMAEWMAELEYAWRLRRVDRGDTLAGRMALRRRALGSLPDACWFRHRYGGDPMLTQDLRYAVRTAARWPGFTAVVVLTLALGIGANAAVFSVVHGVLLQALPLPRPDRLVFVFGAPTDNDSAKVGSSSSYPDYVDIQARARSFAALAVISPDQITVTGRGLEPTLVTAAAASASFATTLGFTMTAGRWFSATEDAPGGAPVAVLGYAFWQSRFGGDPRVIGNGLTFNGHAVTVIGVAPRDPVVGTAAHVYYPAGQGERLDARGRHAYRILGRLQPDVTVAAAEREVRAIAHDLEVAYPQDNAKRTARLQPMQDAIVGNSRTSLVLLFGAVGFVLLIAGANLASLFIARAATRSREVAVRVAMGAGRGRLTRQFVTESLVLTLTGGVLAVGVAAWGTRLLVTSMQATLPRANEVHVDGTVLLFLLGVSLAVGLLFGVIPALAVSRAEPVDALRGTGAAGGSGVARRRMRRLLVVSEIAMAVILVLGASLLIESFWRLQRVDPGFRTDRMLVVQLHLPPARYQPGQAATLGFYRALRERLATRPGVDDITFAFQHPLAEGWTSSFVIDNREHPPRGEEPEARIRPVAPGYFRSLGVPIRAGRDLTTADVAGAPGVVVINEAFARQHFANQNPIGQHVSRDSWWPGMPDRFEIVGVAANEKFLGLRADADAAFYFPYEQFAFPDMYVMVRTRGDPLAFTKELRAQVWALDRDVPVENATTLERLLSESVALSRFNTMLLTIFAIAALVLAAVGIYGLLSYLVTQRQAEMGVRMALGAPRARVVRLVVGEGVRLALVGVAIGLVVGYKLTHLLEHELVGVSATNLFTFIATATTLTVVATLAALLPALRASRIDPVGALRG